MQTFFKAALNFLYIIYFYAIVIVNRVIKPYVFCGSCDKAVKGVKISGK